MKTLAIVLALLPGCATPTTPQWAAFGTDMLGCASPGISATIEAAAGDLYLRASGAEGADWKKVGIGLAAKYGVPLALCAVESVFARLASPGNRDIAPVYVTEAIRWLRENKSEWTVADSTRTR